MGALANRVQGSYSIWVAKALQTTWLAAIGRREQESVSLLALLRRISHNHPHPIEVKTMKNMLKRVANAAAMMLGLSVGIAIGLAGILKHKKNLALQKAGFQGLNSSRALTNRSSDLLT
ncbi:MAG TPA: hypothetical protein DCY88_26215 [Cyanobacteria bacterium UBA11372]|nr:hypothetical protein [Cyanobacteria bacterium UBA11372]